MPWSVSGNLKNQILEVIIFENFCQNLKVRYFRYIICVRIKTFQAVFNAFFMQDGQTFGYYVWVTKVYVNEFGYENNQKILRKYNVKNQYFWFMEKC